MFLRCGSAKIPLQLCARTRSLFITSVRFYNGRGGRYEGERKSPRSRSRFSDTPVSLKKAKLIQIPFEENAAEVTLDELKDEGLIGKDVHESITRLGFEGLTPVQQKSIGPILKNEQQDVIARAKTGTGKTFAFLIPMFQHLINTRMENPFAVKYVIVAPTRDLALQIQTETQRVQSMNPTLKKFNSLTLVGGTNFGTSINNLVRRRPQIIIATPGRLLDVLRDYNKYFTHIDVKVLDEADRLLEIGFQQDLERISETFNKLNDNSEDHIRTLLFSATLDTKVQDLSANIMGKSECLFLDTVDKNEPQAHEKIAQSVVITPNLAHSIHAMVDHIKREVQSNPSYKAILFTPTIKLTSFISETLHSLLGRSLPILEFHGKKTQMARTKMVHRFKRDHSGILVCTDVAARGLDFPDVGEVLQLGVPPQTPQYIHRIGRTARAGKEGKATLFICESETPFLQYLAKKERINIEDQTEFKASEESIEELAKKLYDDEKLIDAFISAIAYYRANGRVFGFNDNRILSQIAESYGTLLNDRDRKIPVSANLLEKLGLSRNRVVQDMLNVQRSYRKHHNEDTMQAKNDRSRDKRWYDEAPFQNFVKRGKTKNQNFTKKSYNKTRGDNPRFDE
ncbi:BN860_13498g1_1 [Zygosaccharomyces bailii CLIB 213]|uniref:ATP-dependent RNA helicase n=1 Tax=Zygosaccharomyces bailii (strain CLIB 213 / ATCC 58445 / CBS 680 / BCRC 21525 / NBRC 1098 / NCYC 1416 / NRRL Y-2227) TaxID=1333698 RepID=A0A8J2T417_ZYGB2|nr:BN860_13498g1_1 [Zygosaccharomyces bailii CLIB 213]